MAVDTVLSKERPQNIAAQLNPDTTQSRVQQTRVSTRLVTQPRPDSESTAADSCLDSRLVSDSKKKKYLKARKRVGRPGEGGGVFFSFCIIILQSATDFSVGNRETGETSWVWSGCICVA